MVSLSKPFWALENRGSPCGLTYCWINRSGCQGEGKGENEVKTKEWRIHSELQNLLRSFREAWRERYFPLGSREEVFFVRGKEQERKRGR